MCKFTNYLQSPKLTLFVETKWAEWWDSFSHDSLRGKVLVDTQDYLVPSNYGTSFTLYAYYTWRRSFEERLNKLVKNIPTVHHYTSLRT